MIISSKNSARINKYLLQFILTYHSWFTTSKESYLTQLYLKLHKQYKRLRCYPFEFLASSKIESISLLEDTEKVITTAPSTPLEKKRRFDLIAPSVYLLNFKDTIIKPGASSFRTSDRVLVEKYPFDDEDIANYNDGFLIAYNKNRALIDDHYDEIIESGLYLGGRGEHNYYHWIVEHLPKLFYLGKGRSKVKTLLVSVNTSNQINLKTLLDLAMVGSDMEIKYLDADKTYLVKNAQIINFPSSVLFIPKDKSEVKVTHNFTRKKSLDFVRHLVSNSYVEDENRNFKKKIFLARRGNGRRGYNNSEVEALFISKGFELVYCEEHNIYEQYHLFKNADEIVGSTGAAWTNLIFCNSNTKALCWMDYEIQNFSCFSTIAEYYNVDLRYHYYTTRNDKDFHADYSLDLKELEKSYTDLIGNNYNYE